MRTPSRLLFACLLFGLLLTTAEPSFAYGGPGSLISGIGALLAALAALLASLLGFVWFPLKRLYRKLQGDDPETSSTPAEQASE